MASERSIEQSKALFENIRDFFQRESEDWFVIRISDGPMENWEIIPTDSDAEMFRVRMGLGQSSVPFAGFVHDENGRYYFYFCDAVLSQGQYLDNHEICYSDDLSCSEVNLEDVAEELKILLQGS